MNETKMSQSKLTSLLKSISESKRPVTPDAEEVKSKEKAVSHWKNIRSAVLDHEHGLTEIDQKDDIETHGIQLNGMINAPCKIKSIYCNNIWDEYLIVLENNTIQVCDLSGTYKRTILTDFPVEQIIFAPEVNQFVIWDGDSTLRNYSSDMQLLSESTSPNRIHFVTFNNQRNEVVTSSEGSITCWSFKYGSRHLVPRLILTEGFHGNEVFSPMSLEETARSSQRCYAVHLRSVVVVNIYKGTLHSYKNFLHSTDITACLFFNPVKCLLTASKDATIKMWNEDWQLKLVFVGHDDSVTGLAIHPFGPFALSSSLDKTVRVWCLETSDEVEVLDCGVPLIGIGSCFSHENAFTYTDSVVQLIKISHIHQLHTVIGYMVTSLKVTSHPIKPRRAVLICEDSGVRIVSPGSGAVITTFLLPFGSVILDAEYSPSDEKLFVLTNCGKIIHMADTTTNPCRPVKKWSMTDMMSEACTCLCLYEYYNTPDEDEDSAKADNWFRTMKAALAGVVEAKDQGIPIRNKNMLFVGRADGVIGVYDNCNNSYSFEILAHEFNSVSRHDN